MHVTVSTCTLHAQTARTAISSVVTMLRIHEAFDKLSMPTSTSEASMSEFHRIPSYNMLTSGSLNRAAESHQMLQQQIALYSVHDQSHSCSAYRCGNSSMYSAPRLHPESVAVRAAFDKPCQVQSHPHYCTDASSPAKIVVLGASKQYNATELPPLFICHPPSKLHWAAATSCRDAAAHSF